MLEQYAVADLLNWLDEKTLVINREYQRSAKIWPTPAKAYLIDTILRGYPIPKIYLRTRIHAPTRRAYREVVDGQQRLEAIQSYVNDEFSLGNSVEIYGEFAGLRYSQLDEARQTILEYPISVEQLMNVPDSVVINIFQRLNTYNYNLSSQELRHGKYQGAFKNAVADASHRWEYLWSSYRILGNRARIRMADNELMSQTFGILIEGVTDGGQRKIESLYKTYDGELPPGIVKGVDRTIQYILDNLSPALDSELARAPHFLMLFAAVAHALRGIPAGAMGDAMPPQESAALTDIPAAISNLSVLADALERDYREIPPRLAGFRDASSGSTQRIKSRRVRFPWYYKALSRFPI